MLRFLTVLALALALGGCKAKPREGEVRRIRDEESRVTCWIVLSSGSISCLGDAQMTTSGNCSPKQAD